MRNKMSYYYMRLIRFISIKYDIDFSNQNTILTCITIIMALQILFAWVVS